MSNNTKKGPPAKKQATLGGFLMQNEANLPALAKATLKRLIQSNVHEDMDADYLINV